MYVIVDRKEFVRCNQMSSESEVFSPSPHILSLSSLICLCLLHWCLPYYLWFGLSGCEYLIMLKMSHFHSLKALFLSLSFPLLSSRHWGDTYSLLGGGVVCVPQIVHTVVKKKKKKESPCMSWPSLLTHPTHLHPVTSLFWYSILSLRLDCLALFRDFREFIVSALILFLTSGSWCVFCFL